MPPELVLPALSLRPSRLILIELVVRSRLAVGVKVAVQTVSLEPATGVGSLTEPLAIGKVLRVTLLTLSLKVTVTVAVSPAARRVLSNVALVGEGSRAAASPVFVVARGVGASRLP